MPAATASTEYSQTVSATGGTAPYTFAVTAGALPTGRTLNASDTLSGTPARTGTYTFTVTGTDAHHEDGTRAYTLTINGAQALVVTPGAVPGGNEGAPYSLRCTPNPSSGGRRSTWTPAA